MIKEIKRIKDIDEIVMFGFSLRDMEEVTIYSYEKVRTYLKETNQHKKWLEIRKNQLNEQKQKKYEELLKKQAANNLTNILHQIVLKQENEWAYNKTVTYFSKKSHQHHIYKFQKIFELLKIYKGYLDKKIKKNLNELAKESGIGQTTIVKILNKNNLKPLYSTKTKPTTEQLNAIDRISKTKFSSPDIAYFLEMGASCVRLHLPKFRKTIYCIKARPKKGCNGPNLTYRTASKVYEAFDTELTNNEIIEYTGLEQILIDHALKKRKTIQKDIIKYLEILYPKQKINKPYL